MVGRDPEPPRTSTRGSALTSVRRLRATQPDRPWPTASVVFSSGSGVRRRPRSGTCSVRPSGCMQEQRAARPRHDLRQLRRDERHRVGDAEAGAHRLRDLVQRVDLAVRERDVLERVGAAPSASARPPSHRVATGGGAAASRSAPRRRLRRSGAGSISMNVDDSRGSSARPASCCSRPIALSWLSALWYGRSVVTAS